MNVSEYFKLNDPHTSGDVERDEEGTPTLVYCFSSACECMSFTFEDRATWYLAHRIWRTIRRYGTAVFLTGTQVVDIHPEDGAVCELRNTSLKHKEQNND